ncbi:hypothetical protein [Actinosynnema sp. ALI-1.44]|uniref:hypothetical protein n=1 Tax=Actinosynnema sp. ALI-1.44 TaxID=1933779 RepID=UPI0011782050|nr:hypothetical protein [Actinosynnema sp. ALI-1.44]
MNEPRYDQGDLIGPDGSRWAEITGWLEPDEVVEYKKAGAVIAIDDCDGWVWDAPLDGATMKRVVTGTQSHRLTRPKYEDETILASSLWVSDDGARRVVVLSEENAKSLKIIQDIRGDYNHVEELGRFSSFSS